MNRTPDEILADLVKVGMGLDPHEVNAALREVWPQMHGPLHRYDQATLLGLFRHAGYVSDGPAFPGTDLAVYRGEPVASGQQGISWTSDLQVADKYAKGYSTSGHAQVLQAVAPVASVVARFTYEDEVVVEPGLLAGVKVLGHRRHFTLSLGPWR